MRSLSGALAEKQGLGRNRSCRAGSSSAAFQESLSKDRIVLFADLVSAGGCPPSGRGSPGWAGSSSRVLGYSARENNDWIFLTSRSKLAGGQR